MMKQSKQTNLVVDSNSTSVKDARQDKSEKHHHASPTTQHDTSATPIHWPRVFMYLSMCIVPLVVSIALFFSNTLYVIPLNSLISSLTSLGFSVSPSYFEPDALPTSLFIGPLYICTKPNANCISSVKEWCQNAAADLELMSSAGDQSTARMGLYHGLCSSEKQALDVFLILGMISGLATVLSVSPV